MEKIAVLGSTGSIGTNSLDVISRFPERFRVKLLSTNSNVRLLHEQTIKFRPEAVCIGNRDKTGEFKGRWGKVRV
ncbi:MAG: 1-deoxy-D-xylulose-5-phosphate reductoisomerase, partial [Candidatus Omnitrophota bacterium]|nr:1-deoxy-D-xylulose-5-phosphate reductoisomerase [Candidatus Omnitrophota bacterium]